MLHKGNSSNVLSHHHHGMCGECEGPAMGGGQGAYVYGGEGKQNRVQAVNRLCSSVYIQYNVVGMVSCGGTIHMSNVTEGVWCVVQ